MTEGPAAGHFYSPVPDLAELDPHAFDNAFKNVFYCEQDAVLALASKVYQFAPELAGKIEAGKSDFSWCNSQFPPADALAYYGMLRLYQPHKILEIGSGFSTLVALEAITANGGGQISSIEPFPRDFLKENNKIRLINKKVQEVEASVFSALEKGDVLFIDSSHQIKCQSDLIDIFFRVMDLLKPGIIIHFHDIFAPDDYPYFWLRERGIFFNEQYFLLAFLKDNPRYRCLLPNAYLVRKHRPFYEHLATGIHQPRNECFVNLEHGFIKSGSFWLEKLS